MPSGSKPNELIFQDEILKLEQINNAEKWAANDVFFELANASIVAYRLDVDDKTTNKGKDTSILVRVKQDSNAQTHTGGVVWETSYLLLGYLLQQQQQQQASRSSLGRVLEVGAGCGLLGLALALSGRRSLVEEVILTEVDLVLPLLQDNFRRNQPLFQDHAAVAAPARICRLDWTQYEADARASNLTPHSMDTIFGTDVVFSPALVEPLWQTLRYLAHAQTVIYLCVQIRCATSHELLFKKASEYGFDVKTVIQSEDSILPTWATELECFLFCITPQKNSGLPESSKLTQKSPLSKRRKKSRS